jgi:hypothetical protein
MRIWLEGGRAAFARTIRDKQALAAADAKQEVHNPACGVGTFAKLYMQPLAQTSQWCKLDLSLRQ